MKKLKESQNQLYEFIDALLWEEWDPIGVYSMLDVRDEYQNYTPKLFSLTIRGATVDEIADELSRIEKEMMDLASNNQKCREVAEKIVTESKKLALV